MNGTNQWRRLFLPSLMVAGILVCFYSLAHAEPQETAVEAYGAQLNVWRPFITIIFIVVTNFVYMKYVPTPQHTNVNLTHLVAITDMAILVAVGVMDSAAILEFLKLMKAGP
ncbi:MAG: hypothetical protein OEZ32_05110 [Nitrospinota bacterium]|nr:hypothetical protein [Nitrospinota bacterium]